MYILYGGGFSRSLLVEMVMAEGDIAYELREIDIVKQEHRSPEFLAINPAGWVPVIITPEGQTLYERSCAIYTIGGHGQLALGLSDRYDALHALQCITHQSL